MSSESTTSRRTLLLVAAALGLVLTVRALAPSGWPGKHGAAAPSVPPPPEPPQAECGERHLERPTGIPVGLDCDDARRVVRQIHARFPAPVVAPAPAYFAELVSGWLDPHGFWSAATDAVPRLRVFEESERLLAEIRSRGDEPCAAARVIGASMDVWLEELRDVFDGAFARSPAATPERGAELGLEPSFDDGQVTRASRAIVEDLGRRLGVMSEAFGGRIAVYARVGRERYFPELDAPGWQRVVLAAALRGYVAAIDPHGQWVPRDEEWSLYAGDASFDDPERLWGDMVRTAIGVRVADSPAPPLEVDDLVLAVDGVALSGLSVEQAEQLSRATSDPPGEPRRLVLLRQGERAPREVVLSAKTPSDDGASADDSDASVLGIERVPYGRTSVAVVTVPFVGDDLGDELAQAIESLVPEGMPAGILVDLRGNAGGSTDGALGALALFLPGVPMFPLLHGGRLVEVLATRGFPAGRYLGPVAVLVDGATASAAEMIAGALDRYARGLVIGQRTYGKGCVQEYFEDDAGAGVLRLTTRLFALPDGSSLQRRGVLPRLALGTGDDFEHEEDVPGALAAAGGPDVRVPVERAPAWPSALGAVGPCRDPAICAALKSAARSPLRAFRSDFPGKARRRGEPARR